MSSENVSNAMAQKKALFDLDGSLLVIEGVESKSFSIDCSNPRLNLKQLYDALFADIKQPTVITVQASASVNSNQIARCCFTSVKKVIESAVAEINSKLPAVITKRKMLEKSLVESMTEEAEE